MEALTAENQIKGWSRKKKEALIQGNWEEISLYAKRKRKKNARGTDLPFELLCCFIRALKKGALPL
jgi:hypothetical protein